jgi:hypothetical protein
LLAFTFSSRSSRIAALPSAGKSDLPSVVYITESGGGRQSVRTTLAPSPAAKRPTAPVPLPTSTHFARFRLRDCWFSNRNMHSVWAAGQTVPPNKPRLRHLKSLSTFPEGSGGSMDAGKPNRCW